MLMLKPLDYHAFMWSLCMLCLLASFGSAATSTALTVIPKLPPGLDALQQTQVSYNFSFGEVVLEQRWGFGGTGTAAWAASNVLATMLSESYFSQHLVKKHLVDLDVERLAISRAEGLKGLSALELGAGLGLVSLAAAKLGMRVTATDGDTAALPLLRMNVRRNYRDGSDGVVRVMNLRWGEPLGEKVDSQPDVVLAADVVYGTDRAARAVWKALLVTLEQLLGPASLLLLAQTRRYRQEDKFFRRLRELFRCTLLPQSALGDDFGSRKAADGGPLFTVTACTAGPS